MSRYRVFLTIVLAVFSLIGVHSFVSTSLAQDDALAERTILTLDPLPSQPIGTPITVTARLYNTDRRGLPNKVLVLSVDGEQERRIRTDDSGAAEIRISRDLPLGDYAIDVEFIGTEAYLATRSSMSLTIRPIQLAVETVPPIANVSFSLEGRTFVSGADGFARIEINQPGTYDLKVDEISDVQVDESTRVTFSRWADSVFQPDRTVDARGDVHLQAGFSTSHPIGLSFVDLSDNPVDAARVTSVTLKRSDGSYRTYEDDQSQWLTATHIVRRREGLEAAPLLYSVESVMIDGTNAVNRYQQRFYVEKKDNWQVQLLLYSARIHATYAVFGSQIGRGIKLQYPDGTVEELEFGADGYVYLTSLARGLYHVQVTGVTGMAPLTPIALSKDQEVELKVLSGLEIGTGIALGIVVALALLFFKRPYLLTLLFGWIPPLRKPDLQPDPVNALSNDDMATAPQFSPEAQPLTHSVADANVFATEMLHADSQMTAAQCELLVRQAVLAYTQQVTGAEEAERFMQEQDERQTRNEPGEEESLAGYEKVPLSGESG